MTRLTRCITPWQHVHMPTTDSLRDSAGRIPTAPAWAGDVTSLPDDLLHRRIEELGAHIGRLFTDYDAVTRSWSRGNPRDLDRWVDARLVALTELERRRA